MAVVRHLVVKRGKDSLSPVIQLLVNIYHPVHGTFDAGYSAGERERALGALVATAVVVRGAQTALTDEHAVNLLHVLRGVVKGHPRRLEGAVVDVVREIINVCKGDELRKLLVVWVKERRYQEDALGLACLLLDAGWIKPARMLKLVGDVQQVGNSLVKGFETGLAYFGDPVVKGAERHSLPIVWQEVVSLVTGDNGVLWAGDNVVQTFWKVVAELLLGKGASIEKKLVAIRVAQRIVEAKCEEKVLDIMLDARLEKAVRYGARRNRKDDKPDQLEIDAKMFGINLVRLIKERVKKKARMMTMIRKVLIWALRAGILSLLFSRAEMEALMKDMGEKEIQILFQQVVEEYAYPQSNGQDVLPRKECDQQRRPQALNFLIIMARCNSRLEKDLARIVMLYSIFKQENDGKLHLVDTIKFDCFKQDSTDKQHSYFGILPKPVPEMSSEISAIAFRKLIAFVLDRPTKESQALINFCVEITEHVTAKQIGCQSEVPFTTVPKEQEEEGEESTVCEQVKLLMKRLSDVSVEDSNKPLMASLNVIAVFLFLCAFQPSTKQDQDNHAATTVLTLLEKVNACSIAVENESNVEKNDGSDDDEDPKIEPIEQIAHLLTELCAVESVMYSQVALVAAKSLSPAVDDKAIAVLFDAIDTFLQGDSGENEDEEESDEEDEMEIDQQSESDQDNDEDSDADNVTDNPDDDAIKAVTENKPSESIKNSDPQSKESDEPNKDEDDDSSSDIDINIDDEDPAVLEQLDKVLSAHMTLVKKEKSKSTRRKEMEKLRVLKVSRVLNIIEQFACALRVAVQRKVENAKLALVFLDLHVRLYEFVLEDNAKNAKFSSQTMGILRKHMLVAPQDLTRSISDKETAKEIIDRFLNAVKSCRSAYPDFHQKQTSKTISRSVGMLLAVARASEDDDIDKKCVAACIEMLESMLQRDSVFWTLDIFRSMLASTPFSLKGNLVTKTTSALGQKAISRRTRGNIVELVLLLARETADASENSKPSESFWKRITEIVQVVCSEKDFPKKWSNHLFSVLVEIMSVGMKKGHLQLGGELANLARNQLKSLHLKKKESAALANKLGV